MPTLNRPREGKSSGVVILAGTHSPLALARSLRHLGIPIWFVTGDSPLPRFSRHIAGTLFWRGAGDAGAVAFLLDAAKRYGLEGYLLVAAGDPEVHLLSQQQEALRAAYAVVSIPWDRLKWACEKSLAYARAAELGLGIPAAYSAQTVEEAAKLSPRFPVVLKPSTRVTRNPFTLAKAWKIETPEDFLPAYTRAARYVGAENVVIQELVPGGGEFQLSYAALWNAGRPVAELTARRNRQFPIEFGFTSTCVEIVDRPDVIEAGRRFTDSLGFHGLIEVEFKQDPRTGELKLLDVNPRPWSWFALAEAAGVPLGPMLWAMAQGDELPSASGPRPGTTWMYLPRDIVAAGCLIAKGRLSVRDYLASFRNVRAWAVLHGSDPLPALLDVPLSVARIFTTRLMARLRPQPAPKADARRA